MMEWVGLILLLLVASLTTVAFLHARKAGETARMLFLSTAIGMGIGYVSCATAQFDNSVADWVRLAVLIVSALYLIGGAWYFTLREGSHGK